MLSGNGIRNRNDVQSIINKEQQNLLDSHSVKEHGMKLIADMPGMKSISYYMSSILENSEMIYSYNTPENISDYWSEFISRYAGNEKYKLLYVFNSGK
ncbi:hypothetical protein [Yersinia enterocolitica]|uniref:hypothetical protein n=1 Tax=Yersinia enterocolitica TaxID=630 RepID=UPI0002E37D9F|nr:hypothetical protein [Yersinia enterocolitica]